LYVLIVFILSYVSSFLYSIRNLNVRAIITKLSFMVTTGGTNKQFEECECGLQH